jgi:flagella basal body P-ring formation protein FlgA
MLAVFTLFTALALAAPGDSKSPLELEIAQRLEAQVAERLALGPDVVIQIGALDAGEPRALKTGRLVNLELSSRGRPVGWVTVKATIAHKKTQRDHWLRAEVQALAPTLVARRALDRGQTLGEGDLRMTLMPLAEDRLDAFEPALGASLRWPIAAGELVSRRALEKPDAVTRGMNVQVIVNQPGFVLKAPAEAMDAGAVGDPVSVRLSSNRKVMRGVVTGPGEVEVRQ